MEVEGEEGRKKKNAMDSSGGIQEFIQAAVTAAANEASQIVVSNAEIMKLIQAAQAATVAAKDATASAKKASIAAEEAASALLPTLAVPSCEVVKHRHISTYIA